MRIVGDAEFSLGGYPSPTITSDSEATTTDGAESDSSQPMTMSQASRVLTRRSRRPLSFLMDAAATAQLVEKREKIKEFVDRLSPGKRRGGGVCAAAAQQEADSSSSLLVQTVRPLTDQVIGASN